MAESGIRSRRDQSGGTDSNDGSGGDGSGVRIGVIGCGHWGRNLVRNFHEMGRLAAVSDIDPETARTYSDKYRIPALTTAEMLARPGIGAVAIATPAEDHFQVAHQALSAGRHVFVEKPLAVTNAEADSIVAAAQTAGRVLMVGHVLRFHTGFRCLLQMVADGAIGRIRHVHTIRAARWVDRRSENALWGFAPHDISMILALLGEMPARVIAHGDFAPGRRGADVAMAGLDFPSGVKAHLFMSWFHPAKEQKLVVTGETGVIVFDDCMPWNRKLVIFRHGTGEPPPESDGEPVAIDPIEPLRAECEHFVSCASGGTVPLSDGTEGVAVIRVLRAMTESMATGSPADPVRARIAPTGPEGPDGPSGVSGSTRDTETSRPADPAGHAGILN